MIYYVLIISNPGFQNFDFFLPSYNPFKHNLLNCRISFFDLRNDSGLNNLSPEEKQNLWIPELVFDNTEFKEITVADAKSSGTIKVLLMILSYSSML